MGAVAVSLADVGGVLEDAPYGAPGPTTLAGRSGNSTFDEPSCDATEGSPSLQIPGEHLPHDRRLVLVDPQARRIAWMLRVSSVTEGHPHPWQQLSGTQLGEPAPPHPLGDQRPFVLGYRSPYLQKKLVVRILAHRPLHELYLTAMPLQLFDEQDLMDVVARQPVRSGDEDHVELGHRCRIAQGVEPGTVQTGAAVSFVEIELILLKRPTSLLCIRLEPLKLLVGLLSPSLACGRDPSVDRCAHQLPAPFEVLLWLVLPSAGCAGKPDPSDARHRFGLLLCDEPSTVVSLLPPRWMPDEET